MNKLVSVCIPAYNSAEYIRNTIDSILKQTYSNIEVVVVDDCSKDNTVEVHLWYNKKHYTSVMLIEQMSVF